MDTRSVGAQPYVKRKKRSKSGMQKSMCKNTISFVTKHIYHTYTNSYVIKQLLYVSIYINFSFFLAEINTSLLPFGKGTIEVKGEEEPSIFSLVAFSIFWIFQHKYYILFLFNVHRGYLLFFSILFVVKQNPM